MAQENESEFRICPKCNYKRGFHVYFKEISEGKMKIGLICPSCGQSFDIGWVTSEINGLNVEKREVYDE